MLTLDATDQPARRLSRSIGPLLLVSLAMLTGFTMMQSFGVMAQSAKTEMHLSDAILGVVQGMSAAIPLVLFSIPIGMWVDRWNRVLILVIMSLCWTVGTLVTALAPTPWPLFIGRMLTGIGATGGLTAALSLAADYCRPEQRGAALMVPCVAKAAGVGVGFALAGLLLGAVAGDRMPHLFGATPWRSAQWMLGILSAVLTLPLLLLREPARREVQATERLSMSIVLDELKSRRRWLIPLFVGQASVTMCDAAAAIWVSPVLERSYHLLPGDFAGWLGALVCVVGIAGSLVGGLCADIGQRSSLPGGLMVAAVVAAAVSIPGAIFPLMPSVGLFALAFGVLMLAGGVTAIVVSVALTVWLPNELRGISIGALIAVSGLIGFGIAPSMVTYVSSVLGGEDQLAPALALVGAVVSAISFLGFALSVRHAPRR